MAISRRRLAALGPFIGLAAVVTLFALITPPAFQSLYNLKTILTQSVIVGIAALGMTFVIVSKGIDLSVGSQIALGTVVTGLVINALGPGFTGPLLAALAGVAACVAVGTVSGVLITRFNVIPFIVTLGMMQIARGVAKWLAREGTLLIPGNWLNDLMLVDPRPAWLIFAPGVWVAAALLGISTVILTRTWFGRYVFAIGSSERTARLCGVRVELVKIQIYALCGAFTGVAAVMQCAYLTVGDPTSAAGLELDVIAAVVIGGGSLGGGEGSAMGSVAGALIMAVLRNGSNMLGVPHYVQEIMTGAIIVAAVLIDRQKHRLGRSERAENNDPDTA